VSGTFTAAVWLVVPAALAVANVASGAPKCLVIGWIIAWEWRLLRLDRPRPG
jgi:hypothetical protein